MRRHPIPLVIVLVLLLVFAGAACAQPVKPNGYGWFKLYSAYLDGEKAELIFCDISNPVWARLYDINYAPRLALTDDANADGIHFVANYPQWPIIVPADDTDVSPLHKIDVITWLNPRNAYPLTSHADIETARNLNLIKETVTQIVLNAPIVVWPVGWQDYTIIPQAVRAGGAYPFKFSRGSKFIKLPVYNGYVRNKTATFLKTDFGPIDRLGGVEDAELLAEEYGGNYVPLLGQVDTGVLDCRYRFHVHAPCLGCPLTQWSVYGEAPSPVLWRNKNWQYSPIRTHYTVDRSTNCSSVYRSAELVQLLINNGRLTLVEPDGDAICNSPTISIPSGGALK